MWRIIVVVIFFLALVGMALFLFWPFNKVASLNDALAKKRSLGCSFTDTNGRQAKLYLKNGLLRADYMGTNSGDSESNILTASKIHVWWPDDKRGFSIDLPQGTVTRQPDDALSQKEKLISDLESYKDSCKNTNVSDSVFSVPSDVTFENLVPNK